MEDFLVPAFIYDKFELPVEEAVDTYYTKEDIIAEVEKRIIELQKLSYSIDKDMIVDYQIVDDTSITAGVKSIAKNKYIFIIAKKAARKINAKYLDTIIYHELCHILQLEELFNQDVLYYEAGKLRAYLEQKNIVDHLYLSNNGHTDLWWLFVNRINKALMIIPPVAEKLLDKDLIDIFLEDFYKADFEVAPGCMDTFK